MLIGGEMDCTHPLSRPKLDGWRETNAPGLVVFSSDVPAIAGGADEQLETSMAVYHLPFRFDGGDGPMSRPVLDLDPETQRDAFVQVLQDAYQHGVERDAARSAAVHPANLSKRHQCDEAKSSALGEVF